MRHPPPVGDRMLLVVVVVLLAAACVDGARNGVEAEADGDTGTVADPEPTQPPESVADEQDDQAAEDVVEGEGPDWAGLPDPDNIDPQDLEAQVDAVIACIESKGYAARKEGLSVHVVPSGDTAERRAALQACSDRYTPEAPETTPEWWGRMYDAQLEAAECLQEQGVDVPDPPSREAFIEDPDWFPHAYAGQIAGYTEAEARRLEEACPQPQVE